jgi:hypothetical protein
MHTITTDPKVASVTAGGTIATSLGGLLEMIPDGVGKLGALAGVVLSLVLIVTHTINAVQRYRKYKLEIRALRKYVPSDPPPP